MWAILSGRNDNNILKESGYDISMNDQKTIINNFELYPTTVRMICKILKSHYEHVSFTKNEYDDKSIDNLCEFLTNHDHIGTPDQHIKEIRTDGYFCGAYTIKSDKRGNILFNKIIKHLNDSNLLLSILEKTHKNFEMGAFVERINESFNIEKYDDNALDTDKIIDLIKKMSPELLNTVTEIFKKYICNGNFSRMINPREYEDFLEKYDKIINSNLLTENYKNSFTPEN
jgi:hypothetical protein